MITKTFYELSLAQLGTTWHKAEKISGLLL